MKESVLFSHVMEEYGTHEKDENAVSEEKEGGEDKDVTKVKDKKDKLMQDEERLTGAVSGSVYLEYFRFAGGIFKLPVILLLIAGFQGSFGEPHKSVCMFFD